MGTMHFACVHVYFFSSGSKVIKGVKKVKFVKTVPFQYEGQILNVKF